jgi:hypothetical protein
MSKVQWALLTIRWAEMRYGMHGSPQNGISDVRGGVEDFMWFIPRPRWDN